MHQLIFQPFKRNWMFRHTLSPTTSTHYPSIPQIPPPPLKVPFPTAPYTRDITHTPASLFRFSALTFNAHRIHYDPDWCRTVEGHRDCVVHGPLNLIPVVDLWRDVMGKREVKTTTEATTKNVAMTDDWKGDDRNALLPKIK